MRFKCSILSIGICVLLISPVLAQEYGTVTGKVITSDEQPAHAISIVLKGTRHATITDETGSFSMRAPAGSYTLLVQSTGNNEVAFPLVIRNGSQTEIATVKLTQSSKQLPEVVVTGQYEAQSLKNSVYRVRVLDQERIKMRAATDMMGILNTELGFRFSTDHTLGETDVQLLGVGGQRVKILLDGIPLADRDATRQSIGQIDINSVERIEIVEGPMSVAYGTDGLGGVINIITKKASRKKTFGINARVQEETTGSTYSPFSGDGIHNEHLGINWSEKNWNASVYGTRNNFGGFKDTAAYPAKVVKPKDQWMAGGTVGFQKESVDFLYRLDYSNESIFSAGIMNVNTGRAQDKYYITNRFMHQLQSNWRLAPDLKINTAVSFQDYQRDTETYAVDHVAKTKVPAGEADGGWDITKFKTWFFRSTAQWYISPKLSLQPGIDIKWDQTTGERILDNKQSITDYSFFVSSEYKPLGWINIRPGIRLSKNSVYEAPPVIPSLNTKFSLNNEWDLRASYGRGFRAPILRELYFYYFDANHSIEGNPDLKAEYSNSFMASLNWGNHRNAAVLLSSSLTGFYNDYFDFITTGMRANSTVFTYLNIDKFKTTGFIWDNKLTYKNLSATAGFSYIGRYNRYRELDKATSEFNWAPEINSNITYSFPKLRGSIGFYYKFTGELPSYRVDANNQVYLAKTSSYHWADITATKQLFKYITLTAGVKNLFNVGWVGSSIESGGAHSVGGNVLTGYGTSYFAGIHFNWNK